MREGEKDGRAAIAETKPAAYRDTGADVLHADYTYHFKPYQTAKRKLNYYYIRLQMEGLCEANVNGKTYTINPGDLLLCRPGDTAFVRFIRPPDQPPGKALLSGSYYMSCTGPWLDRWWARSPKPLLWNVPLGESIPAIFQEIVREQRRMEEKDPAVSDYLLRTLCLLIERSIKDRPPDGRQSSLLALRIRKFVTENAVTPFKLEDVARHVGISIPRAVALFKAAYNQTIMQYAMEVRLSIACDRIRYTMTNLEKIAESTGFRSYTYFHRVFRARFGMSPRQYREGK